MFTADQMVGNPLRQTTLISSEMKEMPVACQRDQGFLRSARLLVKHLLAVQGSEKKRKKKGLEQVKAFNWSCNLKLTATKWEMNETEGFQGQR